MNSYYQKYANSPNSCDFQGAAVVTTKDPSMCSCQWIQLHCWFWDSQLCHLMFCWNWWKLRARCFHTSLIRIQCLAIDAHIWSYFMSLCIARVHVDPKACLNVFLPQVIIRNLLSCHWSVQVIQHVCTQQGTWKCPVSLTSSRCNGIPAAYSVEYVNSYVVNLGFSGWK